MHRVLDQRMVWGGDEDDEPCDGLSLAIKRPCPTFSALVVIHGRRAPAHPLDVGAVCALNEIAQHGHVVVTGEA